MKDVTTDDMAKVMTQTIANLTKTKFVVCEYSTELERIRRDRRQLRSVWRTIENQFDNAGLVRRRPEFPDVLSKETVYLIECNREHYKIGVSSLGVQVRINAMQVGCPYRLKVVDTAPGSRAFETELHEIFQECRGIGEWFRLDKSQVREVRRLFAKRRADLEQAFFRPKF